MQLKHLSQYKNQCIMHLFAQQEAKQTIPLPFKELIIRLHSSVGEINQKNKFKHIHISKVNNGNRRENRGRMQKNGN